MKSCVVCGMDLNGRGRHRYCLVCGELVQSLYRANQKKGYFWAVESAKVIVKHRKTVERNTGGNILGG